MKSKNKIRMHCFIYILIYSVLLFKLDIYNTFPNSIDSGKNYTIQEADSYNSESDIIVLKARRSVVIKIRRLNICNKREFAIIYFLIVLAAEFFFREMYFDIRKKIYCLISKYINGSKYKNISIVFHTVK